MVNYNRMKSVGSVPLTKTPRPPIEIPIKVNKKSQGKKNRAAGSRFELKVRKDLEDKGWIVSKWMNNVELPFTEKQALEHSKAFGMPFKVEEGKLIPAKHKFCGLGRPMAIGTGFPDFVAFTTPKTFSAPWYGGRITQKIGKREIIGVEAKSNGYLDKIEKEKCDWLLKNNIFSKILVASKGVKRGEIEYNEFK